mmetsp:Transcript_23450/g.32879  ORF Transcript_23450/g.32879 Transcript_23450/m.32879 type:complete len:740 (+) Transcript_23450:250-2469(+)
MVDFDNTASGETADENSGSSQGVEVPIPPARNSGSNLVTTHRRVQERINEDGKNNVRHPVPSNAETSSQASMHKTTTTFLKKTKGRIQEANANRNCKDWVETLLPMYKWLKVYNWRTTLLQDVIAGLTVGIMIVPQSMSYAKLAGLPVEYGLYSALMPVYAYALFGSSRQLAVGPVALISLLLSTGLAHTLEKDNITPETHPDDYEKIYTTLAVQVAFLVGIINIGMGLLRLGFVTIFLSHAVVSGFTTGAAVIIGMSQLKYILGYDVERSDRLYELIHNIFKNIEDFNWKTFMMGTCSILALVLLKHVGKTYPKFKWARALGPLTVSVITIVISFVADVEEKGIPTVGTIPKGLPSFTVNLWTPINAEMGMLMTTVISIVIVGFMESIAIAKQLASKHKYELDSSLELIGLGMANFAGAMFQSYPVTGSFSRSAVNNESGAQSGISGMVTATIVGFVLLFLTSIFEKMPLSVLAAIVISGVLGLLDYEEAIYLWKVHKFDFGVWLIACVGTMLLGVEIGLAIAVGVSLLLVTYESAYPHTAQLGRLPGTTVYRNVKQYPEAERYDGIVMVRIDAPIYFANTQNVREKLAKYERLAEEELSARGQDSIKFIILELSPVSHVDTSALHILHDMYANYKDRGIGLCFSNPSVAVMERMRLSGLVDEVGIDRFFVTIHDAVDFCLQEMDADVMSRMESDGEYQNMLSSDNETSDNEDTPGASASAVKKKKKESGESLDLVAP